MTKSGNPRSVLSQGLLVVGGPGDYVSVLSHGLINTQLFTGIIGGTWTVASCPRIWVAGPQIEVPTWTVAACPRVWRAVSPGGGGNI